MSNNIPAEKSYEDLRLELEIEDAKRAEINRQKKDREEKRLNSAKLKNIENQANLMLTEYISKKEEEKDLGFVYKNFTSWFNGNLNAVPTHKYITASIKVTFVESWKKSFLLSLILADLYNLAINLARYPLAKLYAYIYLRPDNFNIKNDGMSTTSRLFISSIALNLYKNIDAKKSILHMAAKYVAMPVVILASSLIKTIMLLPMTAVVTFTNTIGFLANVVLNAISKFTHWYVGQARQPNLEGHSHSSTELAMSALKNNTNKASQFMTTASVPLMSKHIDPMQKTSNKNGSHLADNFYGIMNHHDDALKHKKVNKADLSTASTDDDSDSESEKPHPQR